MSPNPQLSLQLNRAFTFGWYVCPPETGVWLKSRKHFLDTSILENWNQVESIFLSIWVYNSPGYYPEFLVLYLPELKEFWELNNSYVVSQNLGCNPKSFDIVFTLSTFKILASFTQATNCSHRSRSGPRSAFPISKSIRLGPGPAVSVWFRLDNHLELPSSLQSRHVYR